MPKSILITAAKEDVEQVLATVNGKANVIHAPLEIYASKKDNSRIPDVLDNLDTFENIVHSNKRNAGFFLEQIQKHDRLEDVKNRLNLAVDEPTFAFLEDHGIPAVYPQNGSEPIDLIELMLRLQRLDATLYPCGSHEREDFPGFLKELDIPVTELDVFELEGPPQEQLSEYQQKVSGQPIDTVIFHSRRSVNRTLAAFPDLDYESACVISADKGITNKLENNNIAADEEAGGSWESILELL